MRQRIARDSPLGSTIKVQRVGFLFVENRFVSVVERAENGHTLIVQRLAYYISEVLSETKARYPQIQKLLYVVLLERCKL
jgi:hypothetical protein